MTAIDIFFICVTAVISFATTGFAIYAVKTTSHGFQVDQETVRKFCENAPPPDSKVIDP